jgi:hypothetical protein
MALEKDGDEQLERWCEKMIKYCVESRREHPAYNKKKEG